MRFLALISVFLPLSSAIAQTPEAYRRGREMIDEYFRLQVRSIADDCLTKPVTKESWDKQRPELRRQFLEMMGLWPLPPRTDLKATVTGTVTGEGFVVEKILYQSMPGLYVTANLYKPSMIPAGTKLPAILYVCGHGNVVENGVSYGSKVSYQYHPAWFAAHGYVCIVLDTLQLGEIKGEHHGTYRFGQWWWQARGYTPGGVELWNAMRALDYLESRPDVNPKKIGVTGRSGGGATSWWVAAADDRVAAIAPIAGIADLESHVCKGFTERLKAGVIAGHCDCMFMVNTYRWDFAMVAALAAPRPLLLGNSDADDIFPVPGYRSIAAKVRKVYEAYGKPDDFELLETKGPHKDTPELRIGINRFMNRWLKDDPHTTVQDDLPAKLTPQQLKVTTASPADAVNERIAETFVPQAAIPEIPSNPADAKVWWPKYREELMTGLKDKVFAGWSKQPPELTPKLAMEIIQDGLHVQAYDYQSETGIALRMFVCFRVRIPISSIRADVLGPETWLEFRSALGPHYSELLQSHGRWELKEEDRARLMAHLAKPGTAYVAIVPRGIGPTQWADPKSTDETHIRRRFPLIGQTLDGQRVWDVRRAIQALRLIPETQKVPITLSGTGESAGIALYAALFEETIHAMELTKLPARHREGVTLLNVAKVLDLPQAVALAASRPCRIIVSDESKKRDWQWPLTLQDRLGASGLVVTGSGP